MHVLGEGEWYWMQCSARDNDLTGSSAGKDQWPCRFNAADHRNAMADPRTEELVHLPSRGPKTNKQTKRMHSQRRITGIDTPTFLSALAIAPGIAATLMCRWPLIFTHTSKRDVERRQQHSSPNLSCPYPEDRRAARWVVCRLVGLGGGSSNAFPCFRARASRLSCHLRPGSI